jgi:hypothetical protein
MTDEARQDFSADDLALLNDTESTETEAGKGQQAGAGGSEEAGAKGQPAEGKAADSKSKAQPSQDGKTLAAGADPEGETKAADEAAKPYWPDNWREKLAEHIAAGDQKAYKRELKRLERIADPAGVYGLYREAEGRLTSGGLIKVPGKDAKPEEIAAYHKALNVPEKPEDYFKDIKLSNGAEIGEADKPLVDGFAERVHKAGATPQFVNAALDWYYDMQETQAAAQDQADDDFRIEAQRALKEEWGPAYTRYRTAIESLFVSAPGGPNAENDGSLYSRLLGGRTADGKIIGNDPDIIKWLSGVAREVNPAATVVEDVSGGAKTIEAELNEIRALRKTDKRKYFSDAVQKREAELIDARERIRAKA